LRRIVVWDDNKKEEVVLLSNHLKFGSTTISTIYRERCQIEVFFETLKQNLKVKTFIGVSENALRIQIWTALIAMLAIKWLHYRSKAGWSFFNMVRPLSEYG
jgi:IS4 transposase